MRIAFSFFSCFAVIFTRTEARFLAQAATDEKQLRGKAGLDKSTASTIAASIEYLYESSYDGNSSGPVKEYHLDPKTVSLSQQPIFLTSEMESYRIVEYYVDTCEACHDMRDHYVQLALHIRQLLNQARRPSKREHQSDIQEQRHRSNVVLSPPPLLPPPPRIEFHAVHCVAHEVLCTEQQIRHFPTVRAYPPGDQHQGIDLSLRRLHPYTVLEKLGLSEAVVMNNKDANGSDRANDWIGFENTLSVVKRTRHEFEHDIHLAFDLTLRHGLFDVGMSTDGHERSLDETQARTLLQLLHVAHQSLPAEYTNLHTIVKALIDNSVYAFKSRDYTVSILDEHAPTTRSFSDGACPQRDRNEESSSSRSDGNDYECSMWDFFLTLATGVVDYNRVAFGAQEVVSPDHVAGVLHDFVATFGLGPTQGVAFVREYKACAHDRCIKLPSLHERMKSAAALSSQNGEHLGRVGTTESDWIQLPLWLAAMRQSIAGLRQWPTRQACPVCWKAGGKRRVDAMVSKYLKVEYGHVDELSHQYRKELDLAFHHSRHNHVSLQNASLVGLVMVGFFLRATWTKHQFKSRRRRLELVSSIRCIPMDMVNDPHAALGEDLMESHTKNE